MKGTHKASNRKRDVVVLHSTVLVSDGPERLREDGGDNNTGDIEPR